MQVTIQFFSHLQSLAGENERIVIVPDHATVADLLAQLYRESPSLEKWDASIRVGAGIDFVGRSYCLRPGETIAIMPPFQGG